MRKFFLSLLWRAAASDLHEMSFVSLPQHDINILREYIAFDKILAKNFYPVELFQLSTVGEIHNHTPIMKTKAVPSGIEGVFSPVDFVRFYFDGLIAHIRVGATALDHVERFGPLFLGQQKETGVVTISYETSLQRDTLEFLRNKTVFYPTP